MSGAIRTWIVGAGAHASRFTFEAQLRIFDSVVMEKHHDTDIHDADAQKVRRK
jgi:hypothetical protein